MKAEIGVIGMGVMGKSLSRNLARNGFTISIYNRHVEGQEENVAADTKAAYSELAKAFAFDELKAFVDSLALPRKVLLMVPAGETVDRVLGDLIAYLDEGDILIDAGNSHFEDTAHRMSALANKGYHYIGTGVSGGEYGALHGPSIMPSGNLTAYKQIQPYLEAIAAKEDNQLPCCSYIGEKGSGHFVKMVHNGIEYAEMQLLAECYTILKKQSDSNDEIADVLEAWESDLSSYLLNITVDILRRKEGGQYLLDEILDQAANKGTGKWTTTTIADTGEPATMIPAALLARYLSFFKKQRQKAEELFTSLSADHKSISVSTLQEAYKFARIINHHQGFALIKRVSDKNNWKVNLSEVARIWTEGCIIKSDLMKDITKTFADHDNLLFSETWSTQIKDNYTSIQETVVIAIQNQLHIPCLTAALNYFHGIKIGDGSANLIQAQRDYFGAHTYKKKNDSTGLSYHTEWIE